MPGPIPLGRVLPRWLAPAPALWIILATVALATTTACEFVVSAAPSLVRQADRHRAGPTNATDLAEPSIGTSPSTLLAHC
jgi:hypothetical protein